MPPTLALRTGENHILAALSAVELKSALPSIDLVHLVRGETVYRPGDGITYVYFPLNAMLSMVTVLHNGAHVEAATIGNEGMTGVPLSIPGTVSPILMVCEVAGDCLRFTARSFRAWLGANASVRDLLDRHSLALLGLIAQTAVCTQLHSAEQRCIRWLLITSDRVRSNRFQMTQAFLATHLGVRRATVNIAATSLQRKGLLRYRRGEIEILDRKGLEAAACECYEVAREQQAALMARR